MSVERIKVVYELIPVGESVYEHGLLTYQDPNVGRTIGHVTGYIYAPNADIFRRTGINYFRLSSYELQCSRNGNTHVSILKSKT